MRRRDWLWSAAAAPLAAQTAALRSPLCFFSKHLPDLPYGELGRRLRDADFDGVDLTVRKGGHVLPERTSQDLPRAVEAIRSQGMEVPMITTELTSADDPTARPVLSTAAGLKIPFFKLGYWRYGDDPEESVRTAAAQARGLADLARQCGIVAGFHNHARYVGLAGWDGRAVLQGLDPRWIGCYYDGQNAMIEGITSGWEVVLRLALPRLKMVACKDFYWAKTNGTWGPVECPLGEGMVNWSRIFALLASARFAGPISIHQEYKAADRLAAAHQDLEFVRKLIRSSQTG